MDLKSELEDLRNNTNPSGPDLNKKLPLSEGDLFAKFEDLPARAIILISYNVSEWNKPTLIDRNDDDMSRCKSIVLENHVNNENVHSVSCNRLGKYRMNKSSLLRITVESRKQVLNILKSYKMKWQTVPQQWFNSLSTPF